MPEPETGGPLISAMTRDRDGALTVGVFLTIAFSFLTRMFLTFRIPFLEFVSGLLCISLQLCIVNLLIVTLFGGRITFD